MTPRYELVDTLHPEWRGMRFTSRERAIRELERSVPPGRFQLVWLEGRKRVPFTP